MANGRKNRNFIPRIIHEGTHFVNPLDIGLIFTSGLRAQFVRQRDFRFKINWQHLLSLKASVDLSNLEAHFSVEEIKGSVFALGAEKALGPDCFPINFFQRFWEVVQTELLVLCKDFYFGRANIERINWTCITLIPKVEVPELPSDYRPISLINSTLKIISKILASRLSKVICFLVDNSQSAFIKGKCIIDNISTAEELIFSNHKRRLPGHFLKVDFSKAFDSVDWDFLFDLLEARGFGGHWVGWIRTLLFSSKASILINGLPSGYVRYGRGLRQGDPLSPLLFILVMDVLGTMFSRALLSGVLVGVPLGNQGRMCNLHYADDLLILTTGGLEDLRIIKLLLYLFEGMTGLQTNFSKTCLFFTRLDPLSSQAAAQTISCAVGRLPLTYLGIHIREEDRGILTGKFLLLRFEIV